jgi:DNA-binding PadR family transcriptional regulator
MRMSQPARDRVLAVIAEATEPLDGGQIRMLAQVSTVSLWPELDRLEHDGVIEGQFVGGTYPRRRVYRLAAK